MKDNIPKHIAVIMDGNGRWAKKRGLPRSAGHRKGVERIEEIIDCAGKIGLEAVTFFTFSTENWNRPKKEVYLLMRYLDNFLGSKIKKLVKNNIRLKVIGRGDPLPKYLQKKIAQAQEQTKNNTGLTVVLALNYGSRQEIIDAVKSFAKDLLSKKAGLDDLNPAEFSRYLYTAGLPDPDLLVRTSGEMRISNFLLWQLSYAELYFPEKHWPDFGADDLKEAIREYQKRERRFGGVKDAGQEDS